MFDDKEIEEKTYTVEEYLELEKVSELKYEYHGGKLYAMTGGTLNHSIIGGNMVTGLNNAISKIGKDCLVTNSDAKVFIEKSKSYVYPDAMVICGEPITNIKKQAVTNPILIVEVLSKSTGHYDRGEKFHKYCSLPSFKEYILIDQDSPVVDTLYRADNGYWIMMTTIGLEKTVKIHCLETEISMESIYKNVQNLKDPQITLDY